MARKSIERNISYDDVRKKYYVTFNYGNDDSGKQIVKRKSFNKITDARRALKEFEGDKVKGNVTMPSGYTVGTWLDYWLKSVVVPNREATTVYFYEQIIENHLKPELGYINLQNLKPSQLQRYYAKKLSEKNDKGIVLSPNTVKKHHNLMKTALGFAVKQGVLLYNPTDRVEPPSVNHKEANFYTPEQMKELFELVTGTRLEITVKLIGYLGLRREEACGLNWDNVDFENRKFIIKEARTQAGSVVVTKGTKNETSARTPYMNDELYKLLKEEKERQDKNKEVFGSEYNKSNLVLVWDDGHPYRPNYLSELFTKFVETTDLPHLTLHGLWIIVNKVDK
ncbi:MAG: site-specific integrase [Clostridia bacterium]|jgi:integrase|nr:site-specific integrase [Clostridia bacterium]MCI2014897.1 site-specific integrase [Clostridia bacterium]